MFGKFLMPNGLLPVDSSAVRPPGGRPKKGQMSILVTFGPLPSGQEMYFCPIGLILSTIRSIRLYFSHIVIYRASILPLTYSHYPPQIMAGFLHFFRYNCPNLHIVRPEGVLPRELGTGGMSINTNSQPFHEEKKSTPV